MVKKKNQKKSKKVIRNRKKERPNYPYLPEGIIRRIISAILIFLAALILVLSFFNLAGTGGKILFETLFFLIGKTIFIIPLILVLGSFLFFRTKYKKILFPAILATFSLIGGIAGILGSLGLTQKLISFPEKPGAGGWLGYLISFPLLNLFGFWVTQVIFSAIIIIGGLIFWHLLKPLSLEKKEEIKTSKEKPLISRLVRQIIVGPPKFAVKKIEPEMKENQPIATKEPLLIEPELKIVKKPLIPRYQSPPLNLLQKEEEKPTSGDTKVNSAIIKKTLQNFGIEVTMSEINIGPTVTQYTLKPAEGIKLSKITALSNDLALALASHPIRIEAPIPGRSLVGIEVPNKVRARVRLRDLIDNPNFQNTQSNLIFALGRDVSGQPVYSDLSKMPHLLVAGSTGTGKTIFLNSLILNLLYQPVTEINPFGGSPQILRFILIDPKRVEFSIYNGLPHLLCPVIFNPTRACNALKWLIGEMERRFDVLSEFGARDISSFNAPLFRKNSQTRPEPLPYIILIIDELADLMAAKGRDIEAGIVRLAQMARAVGIHLVVATQRPSVEVITGLIKANITSRITFQVASQVDSRTVLDTGGAEKLLGQGDLLYVSAEAAKPRRIQGAHVSEREVKKVVDYIKSKVKEEPNVETEILENELKRDLEKNLQISETDSENFYNQKDPLYEEAKRVVIEAKKASASLLQRRLRIGYARAARLLDLLEEQGVIGPGEGAKPRKVYFKEEEEEEDWQKV